MDMLKIDGRRLFYTDEGDGDPVLIAHGANLFIEGSWDRVVASLLEAGYRVIFPIRAGRGESDPHPVFLSHARDARDCWTLLDHLGVERVVPVGHSQGALVSREMLLTQPDRVAGIVLEDSDAFGKLTHDVFERAGVERFDADTRALYEKWRETLEFIGRPWEYPSDYNVRRLLKRRSKRRPEDEWKAQQVPDPEDAPIPEGKYCKVPALVFTAGRGRIRPGDPEAEELHARIPAEDLRFVVVTDTGHAIHEEQFDTFIGSLLGFLAEVAPWR